MRVVRVRRLVSGVLIALLAFFLLGSLGAPNVLAAPSGQIQVEEDNVLELGDSQEVVVTFKNTASADIADVASTIQYITLAAANLNPSRALIAADASWEIYVSEADPPRVTGNTTGTVDVTAIYAPYSTTETVYLYTWALGSPSGTLTEYTSSDQFEANNALKILRPGEVLKLKITVVCQGVVGDSRIWFFFRATEYEPGQVPVSNLGDIDPKWNLYYSKAPGPDQTQYWWPLHNSYDPYDSDIGTGHNFDQLSWTRGETIRAFAKSNKLVHQKPEEDPENPIDPTFSFHICGTKFFDADRDGEYDVEVEHGIDGVTVTLLGPDQTTPAEIYYAGKFTYPSPEDNPLATGENQLAGSYCFNLDNVTPGTYYTFYIREEVPPGTMATTPTLVGPITLGANSTDPRESLNNHFGNAKPKPVGGEVQPVNKVTVLAPWLGLALAVIAGGLVLIRRRAHS